MGGRELFLAASALAVAGRTASGGGPCYEVTILQGPPDYRGQPSSTYATAINEVGDIAGLYYPTIYSRGFWWDGDEVIPLEEPAAFGETVPFDINDARQIVGEFRGASAEDYRGFLYESGNWTILEPPPGGLFSGAEGINESGQVAGYRTLPDLQQNHGFLWQAGTFTDIIAPGAYVTYPQAVNEIGQVVGYMSSGLIHAFLWEGEDAIDLGVLPGGDWSHAWAINDAGQVAGNSRIPNPDGPGQVYRATLWSEGGIVDLGTLPGLSRSSANGLNDAGAVVGRCDDYPHSPGADRVPLAGRGSDRPRGARSPGAGARLQQRRGHQQRRPDRGIGPERDLRMGRGRADADRPTDRGHQRRLRRQRRRPAAPALGLGRRRLAGRPGRRRHGRRHGPSDPPRQLDGPILLSGGKTSKGWSAQRTLRADAVKIVICART